mmetsp:Transcript_112997/g.300183  ORF Transcript_112997/g.300183 Transcript_112997/m.300183 type:complete len:238 (-) Transcript_112997:35-748(-)
MPRPANKDLTEILHLGLRETELLDHLHLPDLRALQLLVAEDAHELHEDPEADGALAGPALELHSGIDSRSPCLVEDSDEAALLLHCPALHAQLFQQALDLVGVDDTTAVGVPLLEELLHLHDRLLWEAREAPLPHHRRGAVALCQGHKRLEVEAAGRALAGQDHLDQGRTGIAPCKFAPGLELQVANHVLRPRFGRRAPLNVAVLRLQVGRESKLDVLTREVCLTLLTLRKPVEDEA